MDCQENRRTMIELLILSLILLKLNSINEVSFDLRKAKRFMLLLPPKSIIFFGEKLKLI